MVFVIDLWAECWLVTAREWAASQEFKIFVSDKLIRTKEFNSFFHNQPAGWLPLRRLSLNLTYLPYTNYRSLVKNVAEDIFQENLLWTEQKKHVLISLKMCLVLIQNVLWQKSWPSICSFVFILRFFFFFFWFLLHIRGFFFLYYITVSITKQQRGGKKCLLGNYTCMNLLPVGFTLSVDWTLKAFQALSSAPAWIYMEKPVCIAA